MNTKALKHGWSSSSKMNRKRQKFIKEKILSWFSSSSSKTKILVPCVLVAVITQFVFSHLHQSNEIFLRKCMVHIKLQQRRIEILIPCSKIQWLYDEDGDILPHIKYLGFNLVAKENEKYSVRQEIQKHAKKNILENVAMWWDNHSQYLPNLQRIRQMAKQKKYNEADCEYIISLFSQFLSNLHTVYVSDELDFSNYI